MMGSMSRILRLINMGLKYGRSKGVRERRLEEPPLGSLAVPCHLEESASHHTVRQHANLVSEVGIWSAEMSSRGQIS